MFTVWFVRRSHQAFTSVQCVTSLFMLFMEVTVKTARGGFGLKVTCSLCVRKNRINIEQESAKSGQEQQAQKMVSLSNLRLQQFILGQSSWSGCLALIVVDVNSSGLYLLGTKEGLLERLYACSEFTTADNSFIEAHDVPSSSLSLWSASVITSGSKQGFVGCHCKRYCIDKKCKCRSKNVKCKSKCHSNSSCKNKWASLLFLIRPTLYEFLINKLLNLKAVHLKDISRCGCFSHATTRCGCLKTATTRNFAL